MPLVVSASTYDLLIAGLTAFFACGLAVSLLTLENVDSLLSPSILAMMKKILFWLLLSKFALLGSQRMHGNIWFSLELFAIRRHCGRLRWLVVDSAIIQSVGLCISLFLCSDLLHFQLVGFSIIRFLCIAILEVRCLLIQWPWCCANRRC